MIVRLSLISSFTLLLLYSVHSNDDRDFAIIRAHCRRFCATKYSNSPTCLEKCSLPRACSLYNCHFFCDPEDELCLDTCQSFTNATSSSCDQECSVRPDVSVRELTPGTASLTVSITLEEDVVSHVILIKQINKIGQNLTYDSSFGSSSNFTGLYPWFDYQVDVVSLYPKFCCVSSGLWIGKVSFNASDAEYKTIKTINGERNVSTVQFYPYPLPSSWINMNQTGRVSDKTDTFPQFAFYEPNENPVWSEYEVSDQINAENIKVKGGDAVRYFEDTFKSCLNTGGVVAEELYCVYRGFGMGYLFVESLGSKTAPYILYYNAEGEDQELDLAIKPRTTCKYFPLITHQEPLDLDLDCGRTNTTTNMMAVGYRKDVNIRIRVCFMSEVGSGAITRPCCANNATDCVVNDATKSLENLALDRSYLIYFYNSSDTTTCKTERPCDGFYERITPRDIKECPIPLPVIEIALSSAGFVMVLIVVASVLILRKFKYGNAKHSKEANIPWDGQGLGGELSRDAISKESYLDRGNFGYILGGKLKVKLDAKDELTKQYDVALKILKTKVDKTEHLAETEENIKDAKKAMKAEIHIMKQIQGSGREINEHVLRMYGYVVDAPPYILVLELCVTNLTRYLRKLRIQIENKTLSPEEVQIGTVLSIEDHKNSVSKRDQEENFARAKEDLARGDDTPARNGKSLTRSRAGLKSRERGEPMHDRTESTLVSQSAAENTLSLVKQRPRVLSRGTQGNVSSYNDSIHGRMAKQEPCMDRFKDTVLTTADLLNFCRQVSSGMDFLHSIELIHRDLAADNVLLKEEPDGTLTVKICDFGQSRMLYNGKYVCSGDSVTDRQRMFRLRWTAPEIKQDPKKWSKFSDVWSFGVLMWEVFTLGGIPYPGWPDHHVLDNLLSGMRMKQPPCCNDQVWEIALRCWDQNTEARGEFNDIKLELDRIMCEDRDKELGVKPSDYTFCDVPAEEEICLSGAVEEVNLTQDTDTTEGPLDLRSESFSELNPGEWIVVENRVVAGRDNHLNTGGVRVAVDVKSETVKISPDDIAQF